MRKVHHLLSALPIAVLPLLASPTLAAQWPSVEYMKLTPEGIPPTITVESEDGVKWTKVKTSNFMLSGKVDIKMDKGTLMGFIIRHGNKNLLSHLVMKKQYKVGVSIQTSTNNLAIASLSAVSACNAKLTNPSKIHSTQYAGITTDVELIAQIEKGTNNLTPSVFASHPLIVKCVGVPVGVEPQKPAEPVGPSADVDDLKPGQKLKVRSAALVAHKPDSQSCPTEGELVAEFETNFNGKVTFIYRKAGGGKSAPITVTSQKKANGKFVAVHKQAVPVSASTNTKYMVEVVGKGIISDWVPFKASCAGGAAGGAAGNDLANPPEVAMKALSAQLGIKGPKTKACPAKATVTAWIRTNKTGKIGFRMVKKGGPVGPMIYAMAVKAPSGYMATYSRELSIHQPLNTAYSVIVPGGVQSNFVPLKASCSVKLPGEVLGN